MNKLVLTLLASTALAVPALAAPINQPPQAQSQTQQPQAQNQSMNKAPQSQAQNQPSSQADRSAQAQQASPQSNQQAANRTVRPTQLSHGKIKKLQQALNKKGFDSGHVDGIWGPKTREAVKNFQRSKGMHSARLSRKTLSDLGVQVASNQDTSGQNASMSGRSGNAGQSSVSPSGNGPATNSTGGAGGK